MSRPARTTMIRQLQKAFRVGSRLKPLHCGKSCRGAVPIRNPMPRRSSNSQSYAQKERECIVSYFAANRANKSHLSHVQKWDVPVARMSITEKQLCRRDELWPRI